MTNHGTVLSPHLVAHVHEYVFTRFIESFGAVRLDGPWSVYNGIYRSESHCRLIFIPRLHPSRKLSHLHANQMTGFPNRPTALERAHCHTNAERPDQEPVQPCETIRNFQVVGNRRNQLLI